MGLQRQQPGTLPRGRALLMSSATTATVVAWGVLVFAAIDFGRSARTGEGRDWAFLALATVGAVACMFLAIVLASRMQDMLRLSARSSTRPLPRSLQQPDVEEWPEAPPTSLGTAPTTPPGTSVDKRQRKPSGKRAVRR